ncbi:MAG: paraquat-inducible protein A [Granulosicoccaceae bacterium]
MSLIPGLTHPMLSVKGTVERSQLVNEGRQILQENQQTLGFITDLADKLIQTLDVSGTISAFDKTRSIIGTAQELYTSKHRLVAVLILLFSVVVPVIKGVLAAGTLLPVSDKLKDRFMMVGNALSKWSMADVFVVGIFVAYLATNGIQEEKGLVDFDAQLGTGFYYFLIYCLLSIFATQLIGLAYKREQATRTAATS